MCHGLLWEVAYVPQSVSTEWSYCKLWSHAVHTRVQPEQKFIEYSEIIFYKINMSQVSWKQLQASPLQFHNIYNKHDILHFVTK
jgi:leucyl aminopeptidase (aminopeptidase T)